MAGVKINKTVFIKLLRARGYSLTVGSSHFLKCWPQKQWQLTWNAPTGQHTATLEQRGVQLILRISNYMGTSAMTVSPAEVKKYNEEVKNREANRI